MSKPSKKSVLDTTATNMVEEIINGAGEDVRLILADYLEDSEDNRSRKLRMLVEYSKLAANLPLPEDNSHTNFNVWQRVQNLIASHKLCITRLYALLVVKYAPLGKDNMTMFTRYYTNILRQAVYTCEMFWCGLVKKDRVQQATLKATEASVSTGVGDPCFWANTTTVNICSTVTNNKQNIYKSIGTNSVIWDHREEIFHKRTTDSYRHDFRLKRWLEALSNMIPSTLEAK